MAIRDRSLRAKRVFEQILKDLAENPKAKAAEVGLLHGIQEPLKFNVTDFTKAMSSCSKSKLWQSALSIFGAMSIAQVEPDMISYSAAISAAEKGAQWQYALLLLEIMKQSHLQPDS